MNENLGYWDRYNPLPSLKKSFRDSVIPGKGAFGDFMHNNVEYYVNPQRYDRIQDLLDQPQREYHDQVYLREQAKTSRRSFNENVDIGQNSPQQGIKLSKSLELQPQLRPGGFKQESFHMVKGTGGSVKRQKKRNKQNRRARRNGNGLYVTESAPVSYGVSTKTQTPRVSANGLGTKRVVHRELLTTVSGSVAYAVSKMPLNPGLHAYFPWLSIEALTYEMYLWNSLRFIYVPSCATTTTGVFGMAIDFDSSDAIPPSEQAFCSLMDSVQTAPYEPVVYRTNKINFDRQFPKKFIRHGDSYEGGIYAYDLGQFMFFVSGQADTSVVGRIYAEYDITFMIPDLATVEERSYLIKLGWDCALLRAPVNTNNWFGTPPPQTTETLLVCKYGTIPIYFPGGNTFQLSSIPVGSWLSITMRMSGTTFVTNPSLTLVAGLTGVGVGTWDSYIGLTGTTDMIFRNWYQVTSPTLVEATFATMTLATITHMNLTIEIFDSSVDVLISL